MAKAFGSREHIHPKCGGIFKYYDGVLGSI
jgi:hypothetical protein